MQLFYQLSTMIFTAMFVTAAHSEDPTVIAIGEQIWHTQCRHCHGHSAYPGKAPKLKPTGYDQDFVYDRVTNGFRRMPAWNTVFSESQRRAVSAYVMSPQFAP